MTGNPFADGPRPSRARNAAASLGRLAARTLSITIASLCVAWVAFPQMREPISAAIDAITPSTRAEGAGDRTEPRLTRTLSLVPFCHDLNLISVRWNDAELSAMPNGCAVLVPVLEYRSMPAHVIRIDRPLGD